MKYYRLIMEKWLFESLSNFLPSRESRSSCLPKQHSSFYHTKEIQPAGAGRENPLTSAPPIHTGTIAYVRTTTTGAGP